MTIVLALLSALCYGTSDFVGGLWSARLGVWRMAFLSQAIGVAVLGTLSILGHAHPSAVGVLWALGAGVGTGVGVAFLYRGLMTGRMGVVAPVSGVGAALVPAIVGLAGGDRPSALAWIGIVLALPAIFLVASTPSAGVRDATGLLDGVLAGIGFGVGFAGLAHVPGHAGVWPVAVSEIAASIAVALAASIARAPWLPVADRRSALALAPGLLGPAANVLFLSSAHRGMLTISAILSSLYPAATVVLAVIVLREHIHRAQATGLALCAVAVALVAGG